MNEFNLDTIGYFLYMEQQEKAEVKNRSREGGVTSSEDGLAQDADEEEI